MAEHNQRPVAASAGRGRPEPACPTIIVAAPEKVEMDDLETARAVQAWAVLIAAWWDHPDNADGHAANETRC
jgi:hypothetical protein